MAVMLEYSSRADELSVKCTRVRSSSNFFMAPWPERTKERNLTELMPRTNGLEKGTEMGG